MVVSPHTMAVCLCRPQVSLSQASELVKGEVFLHFHTVGGKQAAHTFMMRGGGDNLTGARCFNVHVQLRKPVCLSRLTTCLVVLSHRHLLPSEHNTKSSRSSCQQAISPQTFSFFSICFLSRWILCIFSPFFSNTEVGICDRFCVCVCVLYHISTRRACTCALSAPAQGNS